jgi:hypothetical protein
MPEEGNANGYMQVTDLRELSPEFPVPVESRFDHAFQAMLDNWPSIWRMAGDDREHPSHVRAFWGTGYKGELMLVEALEHTRRAIGVLEGHIVPGTAPYDRPTPPAGLPAKPSDMRHSRDPSRQLKDRRPNR